MTRQLTRVPGCERRAKQPHLDVFTGFQANCHRAIVAVEGGIDDTRGTVRRYRQCDVFGTEHEVKIPAMGRAVERKSAERTLRMAVGGVRKEEICATYELGHFPRIGVAVESLPVRPPGQSARPT